MDHSLLTNPETRHLSERPNYSNCVVLKPWGYEFQVYDNDDWSIFMLCIKPGQGTSIHCHTTKRAVFIPLKGEVTLRTNPGLAEFSFPDFMEVEACSFHSVRNNSTFEDLFLLEAETPSNKEDLFRLRDDYGRGQGYEKDVVRTDLDKFGYFSFQDRAVNNFGEFRMSIINGRLSVIGSKAVFGMAL